MSNVINKPVPYQMFMQDDLGGHIKYKNWRDLKLAVFDLEATEKNPLDESCKIVQFYCMICHHNEVIDELGLLVNPGIPINPESSQYHKIFDEDVEDESRLDQESPIDEDETVAETIKFFLEQADVLVAYNGLSYDQPLLQRELFRAGAGEFCMPMIDPLIFYRNKRQAFSKTTLFDAARLFSVQGRGKVTHGQESLHDAQTDVAMLKEVVWAMSSSDIPWSLDETLEQQEELILSQDKYLCKKYDDRIHTYDIYGLR